MIRKNPAPGESRDGCATFELLADAVALRRDGRGDTRVATGAAEHSRGT